MYYKMKCVHCLRTLTNSDVVYKLSPDEMVNPEVVGGGAPSEPVEMEPGSQDAAFEFADPDDNNLISGGMGDEQETIFDDTSHSGTNQPASNASVSSADAKCVTGAELKGMAESAIEIYKSVRLPAQVYKNQKEQDDLVIGYNIRGLKIGNKTYNCQLRKRRCPCGKLLPPQTGIIPTYTIGMIGHSTAGKTVFLTIQCYMGLINNFLDFSVPHGKVFLNHYTQHLEGGKDTILDAATNFEKTGMFPSTTTEMPPPHCIMASYRQETENGKVETTDTCTCLLCFCDIMGEKVTTDSVVSDDNFNKVVNIFQHADGIILLTDPTVLDGTQKVSKEAQSKSSDSNAVWQMMSTLRNKMQESNTRAADKPVVCMLTKEDFIRAFYNSIFRDDSGTVEKDFETSAALAPAFSASYSKVRNTDVNWADEVLKKISESTWELLKYLDKSGSWRNYIEQMFTDAVHIPVSSIGNDVGIISLPTDDAPQPDQTQQQNQNENHGEESKAENDKSKAKEDKLVEIKDRNAFLELSEQQQYEKRNEYKKKPSPVNKLKPRFLELPLLYFLMEFGIIPPIHKSSYFAPKEQNTPFWKRALGRLNQSNSRESYQESQFREWLEQYRQPQNEDGEEIQEIRKRG